MPKAEDYEHCPIEIANLEWKAKANKNNRDEYNLSLEVAIHPNNSGKIIINYPGLMGDREGFNNKHKKLAQYMQGEGLGAVVRTQGPGYPAFERFTDDVLLRKVLSYSL